MAKFELVPNEEPDKPPSADVIGRRYHLVYVRDGIPLNVDGTIKGRREIPGKQGTVQVLFSLSEPVKVFSYVCWSSEGWQLMSEHENLGPKVEFVLL